MTEEKIIPLSVIDATIKELKEIYNLGNHWEAWLRLDAVIKNLKKEVIPSLNEMSVGDCEFCKHIPKCGKRTKTIEQKIKDILKEHKTCCSNKLMYKELRILVE
ncbi:MAG TPA: hypothetical protein VLG12_05580 [Candidatus Saccharimonadales bacterium]|nr:hypothetical protein [Candidatus Saccharimonadales bacterium]